jgi:hypothetical protein
VVEVQQSGRCDFADPEVERRACKVQDGATIEDHEQLPEAKSHQGVRGAVDGSGRVAAENSACRETG